MAGNNNFEEIWSILTKKWNLRILKLLELKTTIRFNELKQSIRGISSNVLSDRLGELEKLGLVKRIVSKEGPLHVGYILNEKHENLKKILLDLDNWIFLYQQDNTVHTKTPSNSVLSEQLLELLKNEINEVELNFIKDKLSFSNVDGSLDLVSNFHKLESIIHELYDDTNGNKILKKLQDHIKSFHTD